MGCGGADRANRWRWAGKGAAMTTQVLELEVEGLTASLEQVKGKVEEVARGLYGSIT